MDQQFSPPPRASALGSLMEAITDSFRITDFQPTNINFGLLPPIDPATLDEETRKLIKTDKKLKKTLQIKKAQEALTTWANFN